MLITKIEFFIVFEWKVISINHVPFPFQGPQHIHRKPEMQSKEHCNGQE